MNKKVVSLFCLLVSAHYSCHELRGLDNAHCSGAHQACHEFNDQEFNAMDFFGAPESTSQQPLVRQRREDPSWFKITAANCAIWCLMTYDVWIKRYNNFCNIFWTWMGCGELIE